MDNSTGNIDYPGNVTVRGNVKGGFSIIAKGDIVVEGVVEDALIQAGGQIIVKRGIHGMTKGILRAQGNVICKFIENATIIPEVMLKQILFYIVRYQQQQRFA